MASAKMASAIDVRIDDAGSILKFRIGFPFGGISAGSCMFVWIPGWILNFRIGSVSSIGGLIAATLFAATMSDSQNQELHTTFLTARREICGLAGTHSGRILAQCLVLGGGHDILDGGSSALVIGF